MLLEKIVSTVKTAKSFDLPIVHSTVNVATGRGQPTVPELAELLENNPPIDRTTLNAWADADFVAAVHAIRAAQADRVRPLDGDLHGVPCPRRAAGRLRGLPVVDAIGGTSEEAHRAGIERVVQAGGRPITWVALACELQRDWAREKTGWTWLRSCSPNDC